MAAFVRKSATIALGSLALLGLAGCRSATDGGNGETIRLRASLYYLALQSEYPAGTAAAFRDRRGRILARASRQFKKAALIEGSAKLNDGRVLNVHVRVTGRWRWRFVQAPYGIGARCPLIPYKSVAVDPARVRLGSILFIAETRGMRLPGGRRHDGVWYAMDTGGAIKRDRIDLFGAAGKRSMRIFRRHGIRQLQPLTVRVTGRFTRCPRP